jgi:hypothetical protein
MGRVNDHRGLRIVDEPSRLPTDALCELRRRPDGYRQSVALRSGWDRGVPGDWLEEILQDWRVFDTGAFELRLEALHHQRAKAEVHEVHMVHAEGRGPRPLPLLLTHGWPGSFLEYLPILPLLTDPGAHGADPADAFTVVVPSLPGYGVQRPAAADGDDGTPGRPALA